MASEASPQIIYFISGMWCSTCAKNIRGSVSQLAGVKSAYLDFPTKLLIVNLFQPEQEQLLDQSIRTKVRQIGFGIKKQSKGWVLSFNEKLQNETNNRIPWTQVCIVWFLAMWSSMFAFAGYIGGDLTPDELFKIALISSTFGLPAILIGIWPYAKSGLRSLWFSKLLTLDFFIFIGGISAVGISIFSLLSHANTTYADSGAMIVSILLLTKKIENSIFTSITSKLLYQLQPPDISIETLRKNEWIKVTPSQIRKSDLVRIHNREIVPFDGVLESLHGTIDNHLMNGESENTTLKKGDDIFAGAIALSELEISVSAPQGERMIDAWAEKALVSGSKRSKYAHLISKFENGLVVLAFTGASLITIARFLAGSDLKSVIESFFVGILIFCPCLFASIIPLTKQMVHLALLRSGILLMKEDSLLDLSQVSNFYFDKTGTLEAVESVYIPVRANIETALPYLKTLSARSNHVIMRSLNISGTAKPIAQMTEHPGAGLIATANDGIKIIIGRPIFLNQHGIDTSKYKSDTTLVSINEVITGEILTKRIYDLRSASFLKKLLAVMPHARIEILSGDPTPEAGRAFTQLNPRISYRGNLSPEDKESLVQESSAFIGDGLNDTLASAKANVGFRLGHRIQNFVPADFQIQTPKLALVLDTIVYARKYKKVLFQTAGAAFIYNILALTLAALGLFSPLGAVLSMLTSFSLMILSVLRLLKVERVII